MTNAKLLSELYAYIRGLDVNERNFIEKQVERDEIYSKPSLPLVHLANVMVDLQRSIRAENNKKAGAGSWERLAKRMEKTTQRDRRKQYLCRRYPGNGNGKETAGIHQQDHRQVKDVFGCGEPAMIVEVIPFRDIFIRFQSGMHTGYDE